VAALATLTLAACGDPGSSGTTAPPSASGAGCAPIADDTLVLLEDDLRLQSSDNIVAAIHAASATPALITAVDKVAASLDQPKLLALNARVDIDRLSPRAAAEEFATANNLTAGLSGGSGTVVVGAANFPESSTLAELYDIVLDASGFSSSVLTVGNRELYEPALERGEITVFPEYAATLAEFLNKKANGESAPQVSSGDIAVTAAALAELGEQFGLAIGTPSEASDQNAFATTRAVAQQHGLRTLSDFAAKCSGSASVLAGPPECPQRTFCQLGLAETYGLTFGSFFTADAGGPQTKTALTSGQATLGLVFSSDSSLTPA
jgi:osmoprotectant transport system substrate-binding protein